MARWFAAGKHPYASYHSTTKQGNPNGPGVTLNVAFSGVTTLPHEGLNTCAANRAIGHNC